MPERPQMATVTVLHSLTDSTQGNVTGAAISVQKSQLHSLSMPAVAALHVFALELNLYHVVPPHGKTSGRTGEESMAMLEDVAATRSGGDG